MSVLLNVGSGQRKFADPWLNIDINPKWEPDICAPGDQIPLDSGCASYVVLHHVLEHAGCGEGAPMIREAHRLLKPGGSLLVFVPDMRALAHMWLSGELTDQVYFTNVYGAYMDSEADRHRFGYTHQTLAQHLGNAARWSGIYPFDWRPVAGADIARDKWILGMECVR